MNRRNFLAGLLTASAVAVAAELGAPAHMGDEIKEELLKSPDNLGYIQDQLKRPVSQVGFSEIEVFDNRPVWQSISGVKEVWGDMIAKKLGREPDTEIMYAVDVMVKEMDNRLAKAEIDEDRKIIIDAPQLRNIHTDKYGKQQCEIMCGVEEKVGLFGSKEVRVGYLPEGLINVDGSKLS